MGARPRSRTVSTERTEDAGTRQGRPWRTRGRQRPQPRVLGGVAPAHCAPGPPACSAAGTQTSVLHCRRRPLSPPLYVVTPVHSAGPASKGPGLPSPGLIPGSVRGSPGGFKGTFSPGARAGRRWGVLWAPRGGQAELPCYPRPGPGHCLVAAPFPRPCAWPSRDACSCPGLAWSEVPGPTPEPQPRTGTAGLLPLCGSPGLPGLPASHRTRAHEGPWGQRCELPWGSCLTVTVQKGTGWPFRRAPRPHAPRQLAGQGRAGASTLCGGRDRSTAGDRCLLSPCGRSVRGRVGVGGPEQRLKRPGWEPSSNESLAEARNWEQGRL